MYRSKVTCIYALLSVLNIRQLSYLVNEAKSNIKILLSIGYTILESITDVEMPNKKWLTKMVDHDGRQRWLTKMTDKDDLQRWLTKMAHKDGRQRRPIQVSV